MWEKIKCYVSTSYKPYLLTALLVVSAILYMRYAPSRQPPPQEPGPVVEAPMPKTIEKVIEKIRVVKVPGPERIVYLDKKEVATRLEMPELHRIPDNVLSVGKVAPSEGEVTVVSTLSPEGEGKILLRQEPRKFFQLQKEFGVRAGIGTDTRVLGEVYARPLRIGDITVEVRGFVDQSNLHGTDYGAVIMADWRF